MKSRTLITAVIATGFLMAMTSIMTSTNEHNVFAQKMMGDRDGFGNITSGQQIINGTINLGQTIFEAIGSQVNTTLTQAITTAELSTGNNSIAMAAFGGEYGGYFVYTIILGTPGMEFHKVLVDPGNGQVLASQEVSHTELMKMQQMMHGGPGMMIGK